MSGRKCSTTGAVVETVKIELRGCRGCIAYGKTAAGWSQLSGKINYKRAIMAKVNKPLTALTTEELLQRKKKMSGAMAGIGIIYALLIAVSIFLIVRDRKFSVPVIMPLIIIPTLIPSVMLYRQLQAEIEKRRQN